MTGPSMMEHHKELHERIRVLEERIRALEAELARQHEIAKNLAHNEELETRRANASEVRAEKAEAEVKQLKRVFVERLQWILDYVGHKEAAG